MIHNLYFDPGDTFLLSRINFLIVCEILRYKYRVVTISAESENLVFSAQNISYVL